MHAQQIQNICITFVQRRPNVFDVGPTLKKCHTNVICLLGGVNDLQFVIHYVYNRCYPHQQRALFHNHYTSSQKNGDNGQCRLMSPIYVRNWHLHHIYPDMLLFDQIMFKFLPLYWNKILFIDITFIFSTWYWNIILQPMIESKQFQIIIKLSSFWMGLILSDFRCLQCGQNKCWTTIICMWY